MKTKSRRERFGKFKFEGYDYTEMFPHFGIKKYMDEDIACYMFERALKDSFGDKEEARRVARIIRRYLKAIKRASKNTHYDYPVYCGLLKIESDEVLISWTLDTYQRWWT